MAHSNGIIDSSKLNPPTLPTFSTAGDGVNGGSYELNPPTLPTFSTAGDGVNGGSYELNPPTLPTFSTVGDGVNRGSYELNPPTLPTFSTVPDGVNGDSPDSGHSNLDDHKNNPSETTAKKSRGRPKGSKNKPKAPIVITKDNEPNMKPVMLEIPPGYDIIENIINLAREKHVGVSVVSASGSVSRVRLRHPSHAAPLVYNDGHFVLLSLSGSFVAGRSLPFSVTLAHAAGQPGQVFGGIICGEITAATTVVVVAVTFEIASNSYYKVMYQGGGGGGGGGGGDNGNRQTNPCPFNNQSSRFVVPTWPVLP